MTTASRILRRSKPASTGLKAASIGADLLMVLIGLTCSFTVRLVGDLPVSEILILPILPVLLVMHRRRMVRPRLNIVFALMGLWLFGQVLTDIYRGTEAQNWMRADALIIFFAINLAAFAMLLRNNQRRKTIFLVAYSIGALLAARYQPLDQVEADPWKFGYALGANLLVSVICCYFFSRRRYVITGILLAGIAVVNLIENYRGAELEILVVMALVLPVIPEQIGRLRLLPRAGGAARVLVLAALALVGGISALSLIHFATSSGLVGEEARAKNESQSKAGTVLGARPEILVSSRAVMDSPILGHGSWAKDFKYIELLNDLQAENGVETDLEYIEENGKGLIPAHSHFMGAWVWAGILGAAFWAYIFWLGVRGLFQISMQLPPLAPVYALMTVTLIFDIFFSPFAIARASREAMLIVVILDLLDSKRPDLQSLTRSRWAKWSRHPINPHHSPSRQNARSLSPGALRTPAPNSRTT